MEGGHTLSSLLKGAGLSLNNDVLDTIINIGLILEFASTRTEEGFRFYHDVEQSIVVALTKENGANNYYVFRTTENIYKRTKLFHVILYDELEVEIFTRGPWEIFIRQLAETCRVRRKRTAYGKEEVGEKANNGLQYTYHNPGTTT
jgi:hypothetical protein